MIFITFTLPTYDKKVKIELINKVLLVLSPKVTHSIFGFLINILNKF